jgi:hypothetical protein
VKRKPALTELGKAIRERDAYDASAWEFDYSEAIKAAFAGDASRLLKLLRGHKRPVTANALTDDDLDQLADLIEALAKRKRGRERNRAVHEAARLAEVIMHMGKPAKETEGLWAYSDRLRVPDDERESAIAIACREIERQYGERIDGEQVRDLLNRPKQRRRGR